jgi:hypothetical protein
VSAQQRPDDVPRWFHLLLVAYPAAFRREYAASIVQLVRDQRRDLAKSGSTSPVTFWIAAAADVLRSAAGERAAAALEWLAARAPRRWVAWLSGAIGCAFVLGAAANLVYDLMSPKLQMGIGASVLTLLASCLGPLLLVRARRLLAAPDQDPHH